MFVSTGGATGLRIDNGNRASLESGKPKKGASVVQIEATNKYKGLNGGREVWVRVYSDEVLDWPSVEAKLTQGQMDMLEHLGRRTVQYFPHSPVPEERQDHGYMCDDFWVWSAVKKGAKR